MSVDGSAGGFLDSGSANCSAGNPAFGLWANSGGTSRARRTLDAAMQAGDSFSFLFDNNSIQNGGSAGFALENASGETLVRVYFIGGEFVYKLEDQAGIRETGLPHTSGGIAATLTLDSATTYSISLNGTNLVGTLTAAAGGTAVRQFQAWNFNCGESSDRNVYFNSLKLTRPSGGSGETCSVATVHLIREAGETPPPVIGDIDLILEGDGLQVSLTNSIPDARYALYASPTLLPTQFWQVVAGTTVDGTGGTIDLSITNGLLPTNYYRIGYTLP